MQRSRFDRDPTRPVYVISVAARIVAVHPRTLRIYEDEGLIEPARTPTNIRLYSDHDLRRILFELEERLGVRILEALSDEWTAGGHDSAAIAEPAGQHGF